MCPEAGGCPEAGVCPRKAERCPKAGGCPRKAELCPEVGELERVKLENGRARELEGLKLGSEQRKQDRRPQHWTAGGEVLNCVDTVPVRVSLGTGGWCWRRS